jgi:hypothetical protein
MLLDHWVVLDLSALEEVKYINIKNEEIAIFIISTVYFSVVYKVENNDEHANQSYTVAENTTPK